MRAPERLETERLILRRPTARDTETIFDRYASDPVVTRYLGWPRHQSVEQTRAFLASSDSQWETWPAGPYLIEWRESGALIGGTGLAFETPHRAATGYVLARDAWGNGFATEALSAIVRLCERLGPLRVYASCHHEHIASQRVLEKCSFVREPTPPSSAEFPNLGTSEPQRIVWYAKVFQVRASDIVISQVDTPQLVASARRLFREYADAIGTDLEYQGFTAELAALPAPYVPPDGALLIARVGADVAGCIGLRPLDAVVGEMKRLYVRPAYRRDGLGRRLVEAAIHAARLAGYREMRLDTLATMTSAQALYERLGFVEVPPYSVTYLPGTRFYSLDLAAPVAAAATSRHRLRD
jgi:RimJ/RimL family protein N-acetyltransferase